MEVAYSIEGGWHKGELGPDAGSFGVHYAPTVLSKEMLVDVGYLLAVFRGQGVPLHFVC